MRNLHSQWRSYYRFCDQFVLVPLPASSQTISNYASFLSCRTSSFAYILNNLNAIRLLHLYNGSPVDSFDSFDVALTKKGLKRLLGTVSRQKHPITPAMLLSFRQHLDLTSPHQAGIWALFIVAFFSFLRKSNLVATSSTTFNPAQQLTREDIKFTDSGIILRIRWSKTRQHKEGLHIIPLPSIPHSPLCPVLAIRHYFALVPAPPTAPFFCSPANNGSSLAPITAHQFSATIKRLVSGLGLDPSNYSPHSFRRGGATYAYQAGVPEHLLKLHGDWRSDAYQAYLLLPLSTRTRVADIMAAGLFTDNA